MYLADRENGRFCIWLKLSSWNLICFSGQAELPHESHSNGAVSAMGMSGVMCTGPERECDKGVPRDTNIVTQVRLKRVDCAGGLVVFAKISQVDLKRVVSIISSEYAHLYRLAH